MKEPVYIIDGSGYIFRAYYAIRPLTSSKGVPTNAVYGFSSMLQKLIKDHQPKYLAIAFDTASKNFRHQLYPAYKSNRKAPPDDLIPQFGLIRRLVDAFEIAQFEQVGFEADDIIGTLTRKAQDLGHPVVIVTGDKDMMQLVSDNVCLLDELRAAKTGAELYIKQAQVIEKFGVPPEKVVDVLALAGDTSDHVPGVRGIGEKTAAELIREHGSLEGVLNYAPLIQQKARREKILEDSDLARLSKQLVTINCDVELDFSLEKLENHGPNPEKIEALYTELDFKKPAQKKVTVDISEVSHDRIAIFEDVSTGPVQIGKSFVAHDAKRFLKNQLISGDPMIASYLLNPDMKHDLISLFEEYLGYVPESSIQKAFGILKLTEILESKLKEEGLFELYRDLEIPLENVLAKVEQTGVLIDSDLLNRMSIEFAERLADIEKQSYEIAGVQFNLASPKQVADILFNKLQYESVKKTKTSQSTNAEVLEALAKEYPLARLLLEHRMLSKLKGTYIDALPKLVNPKTGRVHTSFNQAVAATGRLSSSDPNLQNIPIRTPEGRRIREAFIAKPGCVLISLDYSQIELRVLAHVTEDPLMLDSFIKNQDVHARTASEIFGVELSQVDNTQRRIAKTINFGLLYGMGVYKLSESLGIPRTQAAYYLKRYHERYAGIFSWQQRCLEQAKVQQYVTTLIGRRRFVKDLNSPNRILAARAERIAINTPIQGTAADIVKKAMLDVDALLVKEFPDVSILLQVHDELVLECPETMSTQVAAATQKIMENACALKVPMRAQYGIGKNWSTAH
jgi:DNA polymerase-1